MYLKQQHILNQTSNQTAFPPVQLPVTKSRWVYGFIKRELGPLGRSLKSTWFWGDLIVIALVLMLAYQCSFTKVFDLDSTRDQPYLVDFYATQRYEGFVYRWTHPSSNIVLLGVGQVPKAKIRLELSKRPAGTETANIRLAVNSNPLATFSVTESQKSYEFEYNAAQRPLFSLQETELNTWMNMETLFVKGDVRPLGIVVSKIEVEGEGFFQNGRFTIPDWNLLLQILTMLAVLFVLALRVGWSLHLAGAGIAGLGIIITLGLILDRPTTGLAIPLLLEAVLLSYPLTLLALYFTGKWLKAKTLNFDNKAGRWLAVIFVLAFVIRVVGLNHPSFQTLDHGFRIHEVAAIKQDPSLIFSRYYNITSFQGVGEEGRAVELGQWNLKVTMPYTPLFYIIDLPVAWLTSQKESLFLHWTNNFATWFDVSALFFLYIVARQTLGRYGQIAGLVGSLLFCFFPLSYLMASDGGYNNMLSTWLMLAWFVALTGWFISSSSPPNNAEANEVKVVIPSWWSVIRVGGLLALALLAHTGSFVMLVPMGIIYLILLRGWRGREYRYLLKRFGVMFGLGVGISFILYYSFYAASLLTNTLPTLFNEISQGKNIGEHTLTVRGFWSTLTAHFHLLPFLLTLLVVGRLLLLEVFHQKWSWVSGSYNTQVHAEINRPSLLFYLSWLMTFLVFSLVASRINLLQKHMLFALPFFALGVGLALALLLDYLRYRVEGRGTLPRWPKAVLWLGGLTLAIVVSWFLVAGSYTWYIRAIHYILPIGTG